MSEAITPAALETLFTGARTHSGWQDIAVSDETLREIYDLMNTVKGNFYKVRGRGRQW